MPCPEPSTATSRSRSGSPPPPDPFPAQPLQRADAARPRGGEPAHLSEPAGRGGRRMKVARHVRCFDRHQTFYDWQHYIALVQKPGALRNGAPFLTMPPALQLLQRHLLPTSGGDRVMAQVLSSIPLHGLDSVLVAVECALESGRPSGEHVLNVLATTQGTADATRTSSPRRWCSAKNRRQCGTLRAAARYYPGGQRCRMKLSAT